MSHAPLTLGTAGHIDHGKTALVHALTGADTDRLPEERARGISIELGYAQLGLPSGRRLSVIDVPGHERFVRTMVAGATGIDLFLMTVAADDGVMPQTREHARVLSALGLAEGVVAVTKSDLADPEPAMLEASELLPGAEVVATSVRTGAGLDELAVALERVTARVPSRSEVQVGARLHVDRVFTIRGAGTVLTGTLWSGQLTRGEEVRLLPGQRRARVRGLQVHDQAVQGALAGQRVAVNLSGVAVAEVRRGDVLVAADDMIEPTYLIDAELSFPGPTPDSGHRLHVHHGTRETPTRLAWLGGRFWQLRLEAPLVPAMGDRLVIRQIAPPDTVGGGVVLDAHPKKHGPSRPVLERLERLSRGERLEEEVTPAPAPPPQPAAVPSPLPPAVLAAERRLREGGSAPPPDSEFDPKDLAALRAAGRAIRVSRTLHYHPDALDEIRARVVGLAQRNGGALTLAQLRDELNTSRKFAQALLEHFDSEKLTVRRDDEHVLRHRQAER